MIEYVSRICMDCLRQIIFQTAVFNRNCRFKSKCFPKPTLNLGHFSFEKGKIEKIPYLINNRWGLWGQSRWLAYWLVSCAWRSIRTYPSWGPSFVIFFVIDSPYCSFYILNPHKTLMQGQIVSHGVLEQTKVQSKEWGSTINSFSKIIQKMFIKFYVTFRKK